MFRNYLAAALRNLARNRLYAAINIFGLAVGFCATLLIALYVRSEYSYDHFFPGYRDVYLVTSYREVIDRRLKPDPLDTSLPDLAAKLSAQFRQIETVARITPAMNPPHIRHGQVQADETGFLWVDPSFFRVVPLESLAGDLRTALAAPDSVVLTRTAARKYFGRDEPLGEILEVDPAMGSDATRVSPGFSTPHPMRVTAIIEDLPPNSYLKGDVFGSSRAAWSRLALYDLTLDQGPFRSSGSRTYTLIRLRPGTPAQPMQQELSAFAAHDSPVYPPGFKVGLLMTAIGDLHLSPAPPAGNGLGNSEMSPRGDKTLLAALLAIAVLIVASASFNFVTLMTARAAQRAMETGVRKSLGAFRSQLMTQFLGEAVIYVALAMALAVAFTEVSLPQLNAVLKQKVAFNYLGDPALWGTLLIATVALGLMAGAYPAFVLSAFRPAAVLKGTVVRGQTGGMVRRALVILQFAIMIGLGITAITIWRQTLFSLNNQLRVDGSSILTIDFACSPSMQAFRDRVATVPGVAGMACASEALLYNGGMIVSAQAQGGAASPMVSGWVDFGALEFYGLSPLAGRFFDRNHGDDARLLAGDETGNPSIVINETAMRTLGFISPAQAIGKTVIWNRRRFSFKPTPGTTAPSEIIGVAPDLEIDTRRAANPQIIYVDPASITVLSVRLMGSKIPEALAGIDAAWRETGNMNNIPRRFLSQRLQDMYADVVLQGTAISLGAGLAVVIAALGLFGMAASTAERRTKEIGIRKSMGASTGDITRLLMWDFTKPVLWANLIAWPAAWFLLSRWLDGFAYHVNMPLQLFAASSAVAVVIALLTVSVHCWRVARAQPMRALRYE
jgi:putative ABC transport system permease protein